MNCGIHKPLVAYNALLCFGSKNVVFVELMYFHDFFWNCSVYCEIRTGLAQWLKSPHWAKRSWVRVSLSACRGKACLGYSFPRPHSRGSYQHWVCPVLHLAFEGSHLGTTAGVALTQQVGWFYWRVYFIIFFFTFWLHITVSYTVLFHTQMLSGNQEMMVER